MEVEYLLPKVVFYDSTDKTKEAKDATADDVPLPPQVTTGDVLRIASDWPFRGIRLNVSTAGSYSDITLEWRYRPVDAAERPFNNFNDPSSGFTSAGTFDITWELPTDWVRKTELGANGYFMFVRGSPGASPSITTAPLGAWLRIISPIPVLYLSPSSLEEEEDWATTESEFVTGRVEYRSLRSRNRRTFRLRFEEALLSVEEFWWVKDFLDFRRGGARDCFLPSFPAFSELLSDYTTGTTLDLTNADWLEPGDRIFLKRDDDRYETAKVTEIIGTTQVSISEELHWDYSKGTEIARAYKARMITRPRFSVTSPFRRTVELFFREVLD